MDKKDERQLKYSEEFYVVYENLNERRVSAPKNTLAEVNEYIKRARELDSERNESHHYFPVRAFTLKVKEPEFIAMFIEVDEPENSVMLRGTKDSILEEARKLAYKEGRCNAYFYEAGKMGFFNDKESSEFIFILLNPEIL